MPLRTALQRSPGYRTGVCASPTRFSLDGDLVFPSCESAADCAQAGTGGGACTAAPTEEQRAQSGAVLMYRSALANNTIDVMIER